MEDEIKKRLVVSVVNYQKNKEKLELYPYCRKGEFAVLAQFCVGEKDENGQYSSCKTVMKENLESWDLSENDLFQGACENTKELFPSQLISLKDIEGNNFDLGDGIISPETVILTNEQHFHGASVLFYAPKTLKEVCENFEKENLLLMPISQDEMYCLGLEQKDLSRVSDFQKLYDSICEHLRDQAGGADYILGEKVLVFNNETMKIKEFDGQEFSLSLNINETEDAS